MDTVQPLVIPRHSCSLLSSSPFLTFASLGILENRASPLPSSVVVLGLAMTRFIPKDFLDFYGRYLYPYAILAHSTAPMHLSSTQFNTANHIYRHRPRVLPYHTGADPPYGLHYLSPYKIHRSIFARVGHHVFKTYFRHLFPHFSTLDRLRHSSHPHKLLTSRCRQSVDSFGRCFLFPGRPIHPRLFFSHASNPCCLFSHLSPSDPHFLPGLTPGLHCFSSHNLDLTNLSALCGRSLRV